jgi:hypothetical protein
MEGPWLGVLSSRALEREGHVQSHCLHLRLQVLQQPTNYCVQIDFCYKNLIWVWPIHGKTNRCSMFINDIAKHSHANVYLFVSLLNWNKFVCRNFGKQKIVGTNGMPRFIFSKDWQLFWHEAFPEAILQII